MTADLAAVAATLNMSRPLVMGTLMSLDAWSDNHQLEPGHAMLLHIYCYFQQSFGSEQAERLCSGVAAAVIAYGRDFAAALENHEFEPGLLDVIDSRYIGLRLRRSAEAMLWDSEAAAVVAKPAQPPVISLCINVGALFLKTCASCFDLDSAAADFAAGRLAPAGATEHTT